jgi:hypothetical protein
MTKPFSVAFKQKMVQRLTPTPEGASTSTMVVICDVKAIGYLQKDILWKAVHPY